MKLPYKNFSNRQKAIEVPFIQNNDINNNYFTQSPTAWQKFRCEWTGVLETRFIPILRQSNPNCSIHLRHNFFLIGFNITLPCAPRSPKRSFHLEFLIKMCKNYLRLENYFKIHGNFRVCSIIVRVQFNCGPADLNEIQAFVAFLGSSRQVPREH